MAVGISVCILAVLAYFVFFQTAGEETGGERFIVPLRNSQSVGRLLQEKGFVKNAWAYNLASGFRGAAEPGGYEISKSETPWQIAGVLSREPQMKWVIIPEGLRKEEIAGLLVDALGWTRAETEKWLTEDTAPDSDHIEGVYFPDTYLIPKTETPPEVAQRLRSRFEEQFAPYAAEAAGDNIRWTTLIKIAAIVQREAKGKEDMPLVAGIIWNRLLKDMRLEVDATLQYARGDIGDGFWAPVSKEDKQIESPYNTYKHTGLPPHPIANPGISAIEAALRPTSTDCLYYLHDSSGAIHCSETYEEHRKNIEEYL